MTTIYKLPTWGETVLVICVALMLTGLAIWLAMKAITEAIEAESKLQKRRSKAETKALNGWKAAYDAEHEDHINDVAELTDTIFTLKKEIEIKNKLLSKVKVSDL